MTDNFNLASFDAQDEAVLVIKNPVTDEPTMWIWTFYGPGHSKTIELSNKVSRETLREISTQREARINGKKWKDDVLSPEQLRAQNIDNIVARLKSFTPIDMGAGEIQFSDAAARELLLDRRKGWLLGQVIEFLKDEANFIQPSATS